MPTKKEIIYLIFIILLLGILIALRAQVLTNRAEEAHLKVALKRPLPLHNPGGGTRLLFSEMESPYVLLVYFTPHDCPACLEEYKEWNRLMKTYPDGRMEIVGVIPSVFRDDLERSGIADSLAFPVYLDQGEIAEILPILGTPTKFLFNPQRILQYISLANQEVHNQRLFSETVKSIVGLPFDNAVF